MKRDWDLIRRILVETEEKGEAGPGWTTLDLEDWDPAVVSYHVRLLDEAGLVEAQDLTTSGNFEWQPKRLTWNGHEFLDAAKENSTWERAKKLATEKAGVLSFAALQEALSRIINSSF